MTEEPTMIISDYATIQPYHRDKGSCGYIILPKQDVKLTAEEMNVLLTVYSEIIKWKVSE